MFNPATCHKAIQLFGIPDACEREPPASKIFDKECRLHDVSSKIHIRAMFKEKVNSMKKRLPLKHPSQKLVDTRHAISDLSYEQNRRCLVLR
jgi:hypothetical protein